MLPSNLLPATSLQTMRTQANQFMVEPVTIVSVSVAYDAYGSQIITSGIVYTGSGYVGKPSGDDLELLQQKENEGEETRKNILVLLPFGNPILEEYVIHAQNQSWRVVQSNQALQDSIKIYERAICQQLTIEDMKLWRTK